MVTTKLGRHFCFPKKIEKFELRQPPLSKKPTCDKWCRKSPLNGDASGLLAGLRLPQLEILKKNKTKIIARMSKINKKQKI